MKHIINRVRLTLKDKQDTLYTKEEKVKLINDGINELSNLIPERDLLQLKNQTDLVSFNLPIDYLDYYKINYSFIGGISKYSDYGYNILNSLVEGQAFNIYGKTLRLNLSQSTFVKGDIYLDLDYYKKYNELYIDYIKNDITAGIDISIEVDNSSIYNLGETILIGDGLVDEECEIKNIDTDLNIITIKNLKNDYTLGTSLIGNSNLRQSDFTLLELVTLIGSTNQGQDAQYKKIEWAQGRISEKKDMGLGSDPLTQQYLKLIKNHTLYRFGNPKYEEGIAFY